MAARFWRGVNTNANDTANYSATRYGATGQSVPGAADSLTIYDGDGDIAVVTGFAPASIVVGGNFKGNILGMLLATAACTVVIENVAYGKTVAIGPDAAITLASIDVRSIGAGQVNIIAGAAGVLTLLQIGKTGKLLVVDASCVVTTFSGCGIPTNWGYNATAITTGQWGGGGTHSLQRSVTTGTVDGPTTVNVTANGGSPAVTTLTVSAGGVWAHDSDGTVTTANVKPGGTLLPVQTKFTLTNTNIWEGGNVNRASDKITFTNAPVQIGNPS